MPHADQQDPIVGLWNGGRFYRENIPGRNGTFTDLTAALTTQVMTSVGVPLFAGDRVSTVTVMVGATAAGTPTNSWAALYTPAGVLMPNSQSADGLTTAIPASAAFTFTFSTPQLIQSEGVYYVGLMVKATTVPSLMCQSTAILQMADPILTGQPVRSQTSGSALTTTAPGTIATPTTVFRVPYVVVS